jgi:prophage regulatory protein
MNVQTTTSSALNLLMPSNQPTSIVKIIRIKSVCDQSGISKSHIYHLVAQGLFPGSVSLVPGGASKGWVESEVQDWIHSRIAARNGEA